MQDVLHSQRRISDFFRRSAKAESADDSSGPAQSTAASSDERASTDTLGIVSSSPAIVQDALPSLEGAKRWLEASEQENGVLTTPQKRLKAAVDAISMSPQKRLKVATEAESAAQPVSGTEERFQELQTWFDSLGEDVVQHQEEIKRLREAYNVCRNNATKKALRKLSSEWQLPQKKNQKHLSVPEMLAQLQAAIEQRAALVGQQMNAKVQPSLTGQANLNGSRYSVAEVILLQENMHAFLNNARFCRE